MEIKELACFTLTYFCFINHYMPRVAPEGLYNLAKSVNESDSTLMEDVVQILEDTIRAGYYRK